MNEIQRILKDHILNEYLYGENPDQLTLDMELMHSGIIDSIALLQVVAFVERTFAIELEAREASADNFNTIASIANLIEAKKGG